LAPYKLENLQIDGYDVVVNRPKAAAYRAPGGTNAAFAAETVVDELAEKLGIDPIDFRLRNAVREGDRRVDGPEFKRIGLIETLEAARSHPHYSAPMAQAPRARRGRGLLVQLGRQIERHRHCQPDGTVNLIEGSTDIGGSRAAIAMQLAETPGHPLRRHAPTGGGHRQRWLQRRHRRQPHHLWHRLGRLRSGQQSTGRDAQRAADMWDAPVDVIRVVDGVFLTRRQHDSMSFRNWLRQAGRAGDGERVGAPTRLTAPALAYTSSMSRWILRRASGDFALHRCSGCG
jgi:xanthine dehydrogenase molybdenum-binding subunit